jgi:hypothetical protein
MRPRFPNTANEVSTLRPPNGPTKLEFTTCLPKASRGPHNEAVSPLMRACGFGFRRRPKTQRGNPVSHLRNYGDECSKGKCATGAPIMQPLCATRMRMSRHTRCIDGAAHNHAPLNSRDAPGCRGRVNVRASPSAANKKSARLPGPPGRLA